MQVSAILCPVDFSDHATNAAHIAAALANQFEAKLILLHAYHIHASMEDYANSTAIGTAIASQELSCRQQLQNIADLLNTTVPAQVMVKAGFALDEILAATKHHQVQLIVMGTQGNHSLLDRWLGSVTQSVLRSAQVPVMAIPSTWKWQGIRRITLATDFQTPETTDSLNLLKQLSTHFGANVQVLHIGQEVAPQTVQSSAHAILLEQALERLPHTWHQEEDDEVVHGIMSFVQEHASDVIVMSTRSHGLLDRLLGKSYTSKVAGITQVPVLSLPANPESK